MTKISTAILIIAGAVLCSRSSFADAPAPAAAAPAPAPAPVTAPAERVTGIGGFFFRADKPGKLGRWYLAKLGVDRIPMAYGQKSWTQQAGETAFAPFPKDTDYFNKEKPWMINFRVNDLDKMVAQLKASGEDVKVDPQVYPNGRFAHLSDPEGNPIELWEPAKKS